MPLGVLFSNDAFGALFPTRGQPAEAPARLALVMGVMVLGTIAGLELIERLPDMEGLLITKANNVIRSGGFTIGA